MKPKNFFNIHNGNPEAIKEEDDENELDLDNEEIDFDNLQIPNVDNKNGLKIEANVDATHEKIRQQLHNKNHDNNDNFNNEVNFNEKKIKIEDTNNANEKNNDNDNDADDDDDDEDDDDDDDNDDDDNDEQGSTLARKKFTPVFLKKDQREKLIHRMGMEEELEAIEKDNKKREEELRKEIRQEVIEYIENEEKNENKKSLNINSDDEMNMPDDNDDNANVYEMEIEFKNWKLRELKRIVEEKENEENEINEEKELQARRKMTDREIIADNRKLGIKQKKEKNKMKFMQKYYHPGVFFKDNSIVNDKILQRNFMEPTGKDTYTNYENVPDAMKRKKFGLMSQTKWTHLAAEDTTNTKMDYHKTIIVADKIKRGGAGDMKRPSLHKHSHRTNSYHDDNRKRKDKERSDNDTTSSHMPPKKQRKRQ